MSRTDHEVLEILYMRDHLVLTHQEIAERKGLQSRNASVGAYNRIMTETYRDFPPDTNDGTMEPDWWKGRKGGART